MNKVKDNQVIEQATEQLARLFSGELSGKEAESIRKWKVVEPDCQQEFVHTAQLVGDLGVLSSDPIVEKWLVESEKSEKSNWQRAVWAMAASVLIAVSVFMLLPVNEETGLETFKYVTRIGEQKTVLLDDGSELKLNTKTKLLVTYQDHVRTVQMIYGEAYFDVAHDANRPFTVEVADQAVTVLGTEFNLRANTGQLTLAVTEGAVVLHDGESKPSASAPLLPTTRDGDMQGITTLYRVEAGMVASLDLQNHKLTGHAVEDMSGFLDWQDGVLRFEATPLKEVVAELNRYSPQQIIIADPDIAGLKIYSAFKIERMNRALDGIAYSLPVKIKRSATGIEIHKKED